MVVAARARDTNENDQIYFCASGGCLRFMTPTGAVSLVHCVTVTERVQSSEQKTKWRSAEQIRAGKRMCDVMRLSYCWTLFGGQGAVLDEASRRQGCRRMLIHFFEGCQLAPWVWIWCYFYLSTSFDRLCFLADLALHTLLLAATSTRTSSL